MTRHRVGGKLIGPKALSESGLAADTVYFERLGRFRRNSHQVTDPIFSCSHVQVDLIPRQSSIMGRFRDSYSIHQEPFAL